MPLKKIVRQALFFGFLSCVLTPAWGAHIIGGEITYQCLGYTNGDSSTHSRTYQFTMIIYRDCQGSGANFDSAPGGSFTASVTIYLGNSMVPSQTLYLHSPTSNYIDPNPGNPCVIVPNNVCVQRGVYIFPLVELPVSDESYYISYQRCCRNNSISNIIDPGGSGATYTIELTPAAQAVGNSSPTFDAYPNTVLCANQPFTSDQAATDIDGDQLVYELCTPLLGGGLNFNNPLALNGLAPDPDNPPPYDGVNFQAPAFTSQHPLGAQSPFSIGTYTGKMTGLPALIGQFVVGICVSEYRNGVLLSTVRRDFQFNVTTCTPTVVADVREDSLANSVFYFNKCGQTQVSFLNESYQAQYIDEYYWEFDINGTTQVFNSWNATVDFPGVGTYNGRLILNPHTVNCGDTATMQVNIFPAISADFSYEYDTCRAGPVQFTDLSNTGSGQMLGWDWNFGDTEFSTATNPQHRYRDPGERQVKLQVVDINQCKAQAVHLVPYFPVPALLIVSPSETESCPPATVFFNNLSSPIDDGYDIEWTFGDGGTSGEISPTYVYQAPGIFDVGLSVTSPIGCTTDTIFKELVTIVPAPIADFSYSPETPDYFNPTVQFSNTSTDAYRWFWNFGAPGATSILENPAYTFRDTGMHPVTLIITHINGCIDSLTRVIDIHPVTTYHLPNAFTPNDDSINDIYKGEGFLPGIKDFDMRIWNRWGELIFEASDPTEGWNGRKFNTGGPAPDGAYLVEVHIVGPRGEPQVFKSSVILLR